MQLQNSILQPETSNKHADTPSILKNNNLRKSEKEIVKVEDSNDDPPIKKVRISEKEERQGQSNPRKMIIADEIVKQEEIEAQKALDKIINIPETIPRQQQSGGYKAPLVIPPARSAQQSDSFDDLFGEAPKQRTGIEGRFSGS